MFPHERTPCSELLLRAGTPVHSILLYESIYEFIVFCDLLCLYINKGP
ncbi:hypothetical protein [Pseudomonas phage vB_Pa-PAC2]